MFCPTSLDQYFSEHFNALDSNHNKKQNFKQRLSLETRRRESEDTTERYPSKVPLIVERFRREKYIGEIDKVKWLVPVEMTTLQLSVVLKQRLNLPPGREFFLLVNGRTVPSLTSPMVSLHQKFADEDGFLYFTYSSQECFG
ncbi:microtubule-associated proteins 1A/1B light chain 3A [Eurytemora carolleeae]|uniref:microtubule-associated proteins 1A/1B light chain 3A n=1 Tax=Eurytemora carolleeae TaxID=1294199 RepID=UPI000C78E06A|nr:microtubule-associated proteins 1A/1B light chain 3A [Eurytemora carolleeae]|eukprot:XP_023347157.1 microtubule-associated proteins 1A/1B light chain 3A-like [Eurytemora affinis]